MIRFLSRFAICALCLATVSVSAGPNDAAAETPAMPVPSTGLPPMAAFAGNSIVSIVDSDTLVMGNTDIRSTWNGRTFFFVNAEEKAAFDANPKAYVSEAAPRFRALRNGVAIGGFCAVCVVDMKMTTPGKQDLTSEVDGKIYRFPNAAMKAKFDADPAAYTAELATKFAAVRAAKAEAAAPAKPAATDDGSHKGSH